MQDDELVKKLLSGQQSAFSALLDLYQDKVIKTCYRFLLNQEDAEDTAQEVFIEVYRSIKYFKGEASLSTWIVRIAITKSLDEIRKRKRQKRFGFFHATLSTDDITNLESGGQSSDAKVLDKERKKLMETILDALPENQRIAFTLSKIEGFSNPEIAAIMNTTIQAIESLIYRAKQHSSERIRNILKK